MCVCVSRPSVIDSAPAWFPEAVLLPHPQSTKSSHPVKQSKKQQQQQQQQVYPDLFKLLLLFRLSSSLLSSLRPSPEKSAVNISLASTGRRRRRHRRHRQQQ